MTRHVYPLSHHVNSKRCVPIGGTGSLTSLIRAPRLLVVWIWIGLANAALSAGSLVKPSQCTKYFINHLCHSLPPRSEGGRQGRALANNLLDFSAASLDPATGLKCVAVAGAVAGLERERLLSCTHSSITVCHFTYVTRFRSAPATVCEEIYTKNCNIVFTKVTIAQPAPWLHYWLWQITRHTNNVNSLKG